MYIANDAHSVMLAHVLLVIGLIAGVRGVPGGYCAGAPGFSKAYLNRSIVCSVKPSTDQFPPEIRVFITLVRLKVLVSFPRFAAMGVSEGARYEGDPDGRYEDSNIMPLRSSFQYFDA